MNNKQTKLQLNAYNGGIAFSFMMTLYVFISFIGQAVCGAIFDRNSSAYVAICSTFSVISLLVVILFYIFYGKNKFKSTVSVEKAGGKYIVIAMLLSVGMFAGLGFVNGTIAQILARVGLSVSGIDLNISTALHFVVYTLTFAIFPAIVEEFFFRGVLLNSLSGIKNLFAVLISALCFALYHCSLAQFVYQFIYGVLLGYLALVAKSTIPCIVAHFINNFAVILFTFIGVNINLISPVVLVIGINALAIFSTILFFAIKKLGKKETIKGETGKFFLPFGLFGLLICVSLLLGNLLV